MWVVNTGSNNVTELSPTGATLGTYAVGNDPYGIAFDGANMWVTNFFDGTVTELSVGPDPCGSTCTDTATDPNNCGMCGTVCPAETANGTFTCSGGACGCKAGFTSCNGTCVNEGTDLNNCGMCGTVCPTPANGLATCSGGMCGITCTTGFTKCSGACVDTGSDAMNCGGCGVVCGSGECVSGICGCMTTADCPNTTNLVCNFDPAGDECEGTPGTCVKCGAPGEPACEDPTHPGVFDVCGVPGTNATCPTGPNVYPGMPEAGCAITSDSSNTMAGVCALACTSGSP